MAQKTIRQKTIEGMEKSGAEFLCDSSVYDVHRARIGKAKWSNIYKDALPFLKAGKNVVAIIGAKGRNAHNETEVMLFDVDNIKRDSSFDFDWHPIKIIE